MTRSNQGNTMTLHTYTPLKCPYQVSTSYTLQFMRYSWDKLFPPPTRPPGRQPALQPTWAPWVKTIPRQPLRAVGLKKNVNFVNGTS